MGRSTGCGLRRGFECGGGRLGCETRRCAAARAFGGWGSGPKVVRRRAWLEEARAAARLDDRARGTQANGSGRRRWRGGRGQRERFGRFVRKSCVMDRLGGRTPMCVGSYETMRPRADKDKSGGWRDRQEVGGRTTRWTVVRHSLSLPPGARG